MSRPIWLRPLALALGRKSRVPGRKARTPAKSGRPLQPVEELEDRVVPARVFTFDDGTTQGFSRDIGGGAYDVVTSDPVIGVSHGQGGSPDFLRVRTANPGVTVRVSQVLDTRYGDRMQAFGVLGYSGSTPRGDARVTMESTADSNAARILWYSGTGSPEVTQWETYGQFPVLWSGPTRVYALVQQFSTSSAGELRMGADSIIWWTSPELGGSANVSVNEGQTAYASGTIEDRDGDPVSMWSTIGSVYRSGNNWYWSCGTSDGPAQSQWVTVYASSDGETVATSFYLTVYNAAPTAGFTNANGGWVYEGSPATVYFYGQYDPSPEDTNAGFTYWYDFDANGSFEYATGSSSATVPAAYLDDGPGWHTVHDRVSDKDGGYTDYYTSIYVYNVAPTAGFGGPSAVNEGSAAVVSFSGQWDPSAADRAWGFYYSYDFDGNGSYEVADTGSSAWTVPSAYFDDGPGWHPVRGRIRDKDGGFSEYTAWVYVSNVAPTATGGLGNSGPVGEGSTATVTFTGQTDPSAADRAAGYRYSYDFDNNGSFEITDSPSASATVPASYLDDGPGTRVVRGRIKDKDNDYTDYTTSVTVNNVAPSGGSFSNSGPVGEGSTATVSFSGQTDPSAADRNAGFRYSYDFDNNGTFEILDSSSPTAAVPATYLADGPSARTVRGRVKDKDGGPTDYTTTITVNNVAPTFDAGGDATLLPPDQGAFARTGITITDPGSPETFAGTVNWGDGTAAQSLVVDQPNRRFNLAHTYTVEGTFTVAVSLGDGDPGVVTDTFLVSVTLNTPPTVSSDKPAVAANEGGVVANTGTFGDPQGNGTVTLTASIGTVTKNDAAGTWSWSLNAADGPAGGPVTVTATDNYGAKATTTFSYSVNNVAPTIVLSGAANVNEGAVYTLDLGAVSDPGQDAITSYTIDWGDGTTTPGSGSPANTTAYHVYPDGPATVTYMVRVTDEDGSFLAGSQKVTVDNVAPAIALTGAATVDEGSPYTLNLGAVTDPGTDTVTGYTIDWGDGVTTPGSGSPVNQTAAHTYTDGPNSYTITVSLADEDGTFPAAGRLGVTVKNAAPRVAADEEAVTVNEAVAAANTGTWSDPGVDTVTLSASSGTVIKNANGTWSWSFAATDGPTQSRPVTVTATDSDGATQSVVFNLTVVNVRPTANPDVGATNEDTATAGDVLANDTDPAGPNDPLAVTGFAGVSALGAAVTVAANGAYTYDPAGRFDSLAAGQVVTDTFTYTVGDDDNGTDVGTVTVTVTGVNDGPAAASASLFAAEDGPALTTVVLTDDADNDDAPNTLAYQIVDQPAEGTVTANGDGTFTFGPGAAFQDLAAGQARTVTFRYRATDRHGAWAESTVTVTVSGVNDAPTASAAALSAAEDGSAVSTGVLTDDVDSNDTPATLTYTLVSGPAEGAVTVNGDGTFTFSPGTAFQDLAAGQARAVSFRYRATDAYGAAAENTVLVTVTGVNDAPVAVGGDGPYRVDEGGTLTVAAPGVLGNDSDVDHNGITAEVVTTVSHGTLTLNTDGSFTYVHDGGESESDGFTYRVLDGTTYSDTVTVTITIDPVNDAPVASSATPTADEDTAVEIDLWTLVSDIETADADLSFAVGGATHGAVALGPDGHTAVFTPAANFDGPASFTYTVTDAGDGASAAIAVGPTAVGVTVRNLVDLSGRVFLDQDNDGAFEPADGDAGRAGVTVQVWDAALTKLYGQTTTAADGTYRLDANLPAGSYKVVEAFDEAAAGLLDGKETAGGLGGVVTDGQDSNAIGVTVAAGDPDVGGYAFAEILPSRLQGLVWVDFNDDGEVNFGEKAVAGATLTLTGTDDRGNPVARTMPTDAQGIAEFLALRPGTYALAEAQPAGYADGADTRGTVNGAPTGTVSNDQFGQIVLALPGSDAVNYNFGERPAAGGSVQPGQTATIAFWQNKNGQALLAALNGGPAATQLAGWLAATFPNLYGAGAGANNLTGKTNADVACLYVRLFKRTGQDLPNSGPVKLDAQVLATALSVYVTNQTLAGTVAAGYGFQVSQYGLGAATVNVASAGSAFGVANDTTLTVLDLLLAVNDRTVNGVLYDLDGSGTISTAERDLRVLAHDVFADLNQ